MSSGQSTPARHPEHCRASGCDTAAGSAGFMCDQHWPLVPAAMRHAIAAGPATMAPAAYSSLATAAIAAVAHKESRAAPRPRRPAAPAVPVQLSLFEFHTAT